MLFIFAEKETFQPDFNMLLTYSGVEKGSIESMLHEYTYYTQDITSSFYA